MLITGTSFADTLTGTEQNDDISGFSGNDTISGLGGDDTLNGGLGDDTLNGGDGTDIAIYVGRSDEFIVNVSGGVVTVTDTFAFFNQGADTLTNIEFIRFSNETLSVAQLTSGTTPSAPTGTGSTNVLLSANFSDPTGALTGFQDQIMASLQAAWDHWTQYFNAETAVTIEVEVGFSSEPGVLAQAGSLSFPSTGAVANGLVLRQSGAVFEIATGIDPNGASPDGILLLSSDPSVFTYTTGPDDAVTSGTFDAFTVMVHELGHIFGFNGFLDSSTGQPGSPSFGQAIYDQFVTIDAAGNLFFEGPNAVAQNGGPVALASGDAFHLSDVTDVMSPSLSPGTQEQVSLLDLAMLLDIGVPVAMPSAVAEPPATWSLVDVARFLSADGGHFFAVGNAEQTSANSDTAGFTFEGNAFQAPSLAGTGTVEVFRFLNTNMNAHFFTTDADEKTAIEANLSNFEFTGVEFHGFASEVAGTRPVFRLLNTDTGGHFFTADANEKDGLIAALPNFTDEGIAFYAFDANVDVDLIGLSGRLDALVTDG